MRNIVCAVLLAVWLCSALPAQVQCSSQSLRGNWSTSSLGWAIPTAEGPWGAAGQTLPIVGLGVATIDHAGKMTGPGTAVMAGLVFDYEMAGTVEVNSDCTGLLKYSLKMKGFPNLPGYIERFVLDPARQEMVSVSVQSPISKPMWVATWRRISPVAAPVAWP
jgi:hypothetical protein